MLSNIKLFLFVCVESCCASNSLLKINKQKRTLLITNALVIRRVNKFY